MSTDTKRKVLKYLSAMAGVFLTVGFGYFAVQLLPKAVSYSIVNEKNVYRAGNTVNVKESLDTLYESINLIPEKNQYTIKSEKDEIYVFFEETALYRIKARLSDFPANDVYLLQSGMVICSKDELCEIVGYMES